MSKNKKHIDQLTPELIDKYYKGLLSDEEQYLVERLMLNSSFDNEAMEGFDQYEGDIYNDLSKINDQLEERISIEKNDNVFFYIKIAASIVLLALSTYLVWDIANDNQKQTSIAQNEPLKTDDIKTPEAESILGNKEESIVDAEARSASGENATPEIKSGKSQEIDNSELQNENLIASNSRPEKKDADLVEPIEIAASDEITLSEIVADEEMADEAFKQRLALDTSTANALTGKVAGVNIANQGAPPIRVGELEPQAKEESSPILESRKKAVSRSTSRNADLSAELAPSMLDQERIPSTTITGKITSIDDGQPLPGVNVVVKGTTKGAVTGIDGRFEIDDIEASEKDALVISFIGLATEEVEIGARSQIDVQMGSDVSQLSEIVVVGYGISSKSEVDNSINTWDNSRPSIPMSEYKDYLKENTRYDSTGTVKGKVVLKFDILENGRLTNFEIKRSLNDYYDNEAIRLIKDGPEWLPAEQNGEKALSTARITVRFVKD